MLVTVVRHFVKSGQMPAARKRVDGNSAIMAGRPGCLFRHTGTPAGGGDEVVTVTAWRSLADKRAWDDYKATLKQDIDAKLVYDKVESYDVDIYDERWTKELPRL